MKPQTFSAVVGVGHKEVRYLLVPFDPAVVWPGLAKVKIPRPDDPRGGQGWLVTGTMNGKAFDGHIGQRYGNTYMILNDGLLKHVGVDDGSAVDVVVAPLPSVMVQKTPAKKKTQTSKKTVTTTKKKMKKKKKKKKKEA